MSMLLRRIPVVVIAVLSFTNRVGGSEQHECQRPDYSGHMRLVAEWARQLDPIHNAVMRKTRKGDYRTRFGTIIDRTCFDGASENEKTGVIHFFESKLSYALIRSVQCFEQFGFRELDPTSHGVLSILRRSVILCNPDDGPALMATRNAKWSPQDSLFTFTAAGYLNDYKFFLKKKLNTPDLYLSPKDRDMETATYSGALFHEALHHLPLNNRAWHDQAHQRAVRGCVNSLYEDKIYLIQAACFPESKFGFAFNNKIHSALATTQSSAEVGALWCPGVCEKALIEVDRDLPGGMSNAFGHQLMAFPYSKDEASRICEKIRTTQSKILNLRDKTLEIESLVILETRGDLILLDDLRDQLQNFLISILDLSYFTSNHDRLEITKRYDQFLEFLDQRCTRTSRNRNWEDFCSGRMKKFRERINSIFDEFRATDTVH